MAKKRLEPAPVERKGREGRVMVSFSHRDHTTLARQAKQARLPVATYARLLILGQLMKPGASKASA